MTQRKPKATEYRDRIRELRRVPAHTLRPHPQNWRKHPPAQKQALQQLLDDIGYADALLARECDDGQLELIDGHLRAETTPHQLVPVLIVDLDQREAATILATHDPLAALAEVETERLDGLLNQIDLKAGPVQQMLADLMEQSRLLGPIVMEADDQSAELVDVYQILIDCTDEAEQRELLQLLTEKGIRCRALIA